MTIEDDADWPAVEVILEPPAARPIPELRVVPYRRPLSREARPGFRLWQGFAVAAGLHVDAALVALAISTLHFRSPPPPPEAPPISIQMVETTPPGNTLANVTQNHVAPPKPAPPVPVKTPARPAVIVPVLAVRAPQPSRVAPPPAPPPPAPARLAPIPPALVQGSKTPVQHEVVAGGLTRPAKAIHETTVFYSMFSRANGQEGQVRLTVVVLPNGMPGGVTVVASSGYTMLDNVARNNVMTYRFQPALKDGVPVASTLTYVFKFALQ